MQVQRIIGFDMPKAKKEQNQQTPYVSKINNDLRADSISFKGLNNVEVASSWSETKRLLSKAITIIDRRTSNVMRNQLRDYGHIQTEPPILKGVIDGWNVTFEMTDAVSYGLKTENGKVTHQYIYKPCTNEAIQTGTYEGGGAYVGFELFGMNKKSEWNAEMLKFLKGLNIEGLRA